jgi:hypothetical protein
MDMRARMISRLRIGLLATLLVAAGGLACNTPSVPLPPPALDFISFQPASAPDMVFLQGQPVSGYANARFFVFNVNRKVGVIADAAADGSFTTDPFPGVTGETVEIYYEPADGGERSPSVCTTLQIGAALIGSDCL